MFLEKITEFQQVIEEYLKGETIEIINKEGKPIYPSLSTFEYLAAGIVHKFLMSDLCARDYKVTYLALLEGKQKEHEAILLEGEDDLP